MDLKAEHSVTPDEANKARDELRVLDFEREIVIYALERIHEAEKEGKISEEERNRLSSRYQEKIEKIEDKISRSEAIATLHELETMQEDLLKQFSESFGDLNQKIEEVRSRLEIKEREKRRFSFFHPIKHTEKISSPEPSPKAIIGKGDSMLPKCPECGEEVDNPIKEWDVSSKLHVRLYEHCGKKFRKYGKSIPYKKDNRRHSTFPRKHREKKKFSFTSQELSPKAIKTIFALILIAFGLSS